MVLHSWFPNKEKCVCVFASMNVLTEYISVYFSVMIVCEINGCWTQKTRKPGSVHVGERTVKTPLLSRRSRYASLKFHLFLAWGSNFLFILFWKELTWNYHSMLKDLTKKLGDFMHTHFPVKLFSELTYLGVKCHNFSHISLLWNRIWDNYNFLLPQIHFLHEILWMLQLSHNTKNFTFQLRPIIFIK